MNSNDRKRQRHYLLLKKEGAGVSADTIFFLYALGVAFTLIALIATEPPLTMRRMGKE